jgi:ribosomal protein S18 acetylase RimI-like enzyme
MQSLFNNPSISIAGNQDIDELVTLVNSAYRGEGSKKGWTTEALLLDGIRVNQEAVQKQITAPGAVILKYTDESGSLIGCVYLQKQDTRIYLGMLTVSPGLQAKGIGKQLLAASEVYAVQQGCNMITMTVISVRVELIAWYKRHGYRATGETRPFPKGPEFGTPKQELEFIVLEKQVI